MLVVNNLSPDPQDLSLDLSAHAGRQLVDLFTDEVIGLTPPQTGRLQLAGYGYRWFQLA